MAQLPASENLWPVNVSHVLAFTEEKNNPFFLRNIHQIYCSVARAWLRLSRPSGSGGPPAIEESIHYLRHGFKVNRSPMKEDLIFVRNTGTDTHLRKAIEEGDLEFFEQLAHRIKAVEKPETNTEPDKLNSFLISFWAPGLGKDLFWPGLAYLKNPAKLQCWLTHSGNSRCTESALIKRCQRLGLLPLNRFWKFGQPSFMRISRRVVWHSLALG
ncbi:MAG: hypothetical protein JWM16_3406 [Verrucomicrobiales bacterium]|nr:hypothetical protein [Verrucomicrobiales bacterium]